MTTNQLILEAPEGQPTIDFTRELDAPLEAVFQAHRDPELVRQWLGPHGYGMEMHEYDFRSGGRWRYVHTDPHGQEFGFRGCFHTIRDNDLIVQTFEFDGSPDHVSLDLMHFERLEGGRTRLRGHSVFLVVQDRDAMITSGMEGGMREGYERLAALLARATQDVLPAAPTPRRPGLRGREPTRTRTRRKPAAQVRGSNRGSRARQPSSTNARKSPATTTKDGAMPTCVTTRRSMPTTRVLAHTTTPGPRSTGHRAERHRTKPHPAAVPTRKGRATRSTPSTALPSP